jgi:hypothetical protein
VSFSIFTGSLAGDPLGDQTQVNGAHMLARRTYEAYEVMLYHVPAQNDALRSKLIPSPDPGK